MKVYKYVFDYKFGLDVLNPTCEFKNKSSSKIKKIQSFFPFIKGYVPDMGRFLFS